MKKVIWIILFVAIIAMTTVANATIKEKQEDLVYENLSEWISKTPEYEDFIINEADDGYVRYISTIDSDFFTEQKIDYHDYDTIKSWFETRYPSMLKDSNNMCATCSFNEIGYYNGQHIYMIVIAFDKPEDEIVGLKFIASFY